MGDFLVVSDIRNSCFSIVEVRTRFLMTASKPDWVYNAVGECERGMGGSWVRGDIRSSYFSIVEVVTRFLTTAIKPDQKYIEVGECEVGWEVLELELM